MIEVSEVVQGTIPMPSAVNAQQDLLPMHWGGKCGPHSWATVPKSHDDYYIVLFTTAGYTVQYGGAVCHAVKF